MKVPASNKEFVRMDREPEFISGMQADANGTLFTLKYENYKLYTKYVDFSVIKHKTVIKLN